MPMTVEQLLQEAMALPGAARAQLAENLTTSLEEAPAARRQPLWLTKAGRRRDEIRNGTVVAIPGETVLAEIRRLVAE